MRVGATRYGFVRESTFLRRFTIESRRQSNVCSFGLSGYSNGFGPHSDECRTTQRSEFLGSHGNSSARGSVHLRVTETRLARKHWQLHESLGSFLISTRSEVLAI